VTDTYLLDDTVDMLKCEVMCLHLEVVVWWLLLYVLTKEWTTQHFDVILTTSKARLTLPHQSHSKQ